MDAKVPKEGLGLTCEDDLARTAPPRTGGGATYGEPPVATAASIDPESPCPLCKAETFPEYDDFAFGTAIAIPV